MENDDGATSTTTTTTLENTTTTNVRKEEAEVDTVRLALVCLMDATELDGSDPTTWLKLACAARRLGRLLLAALHGNRCHGQSCCLRYRRLERHALERGQSCLPAHVPPNRTILRALQQWLEEEQQQQDPDESSPSSSTSPQQQQQPEQESSMTLTLELPRYSWAVLGRMLLRACREGNHYHQHHAPAQTTSATTTHNTWLFASPGVIIKLSPMLSGAVCICCFCEAHGGGGGGKCHYWQ
jgi:hypothetical protein